MHPTLGIHTGQYFAKYLIKFLFLELWGNHVREINGSHTTCLPAAVCTIQLCANEAWATSTPLQADSVPLQRPSVSSPDHR